jgi:hypothetical protein
MHLQQCKLVLHIFISASRSAFVNLALISNASLAGSLQELAGLVVAVALCFQIIVHQLHHPS